MLIFLLGVNCDKQYTKSDGSLTCGFYVNGPLNFHEAVHECNLYGGLLPTVISEDDNQHLINAKVIFSICILKIRRQEHYIKNNICKNPFANINSGI